jgi:hypothetical protein
MKSKAYRTLFSLLLVAYGSGVIGANSKWQFGLAAFFIASGIMIYSKEKY